MKNSISPTAGFWSVMDVLRGSRDIQTTRLVAAILYFLRLEWVQHQASESPELLRSAWWEYSREYRDAATISARIVKLTGKDDVGERCLELLNGFGDDRHMTALFEQLFDALGEIDHRNDAASAHVQFSRFLEWTASSLGKKYSAPTTPPSVANLMLELVDPKEGQTLHDPFGGELGVLGLAIAEGVQPELVSSVEINEDAYLVAALVGSLAGVPPGNLRQANSLTSSVRRPSGGIESYSCVVADPPLGVKDWGVEPHHLIDDPRYWSLGKAVGRRGDLAALLHATSIAANACVVTTSSSVLSRESSADRRLRASWLEDDILESVILLPQNLRPDTGIAFALLTFSRLRHRKPMGQVLFIDASELGTPQSRSINVLTPEAIAQIADTVKDFRHGRLSAGIVVPRFASVATHQDIVARDGSLALSSYVDMVEERELPGAGVLLHKWEEVRGELRSGEAAFFSLTEALAG